MKTCSIEGCNNKHCAKGLCRKHYDQMRREKKELENKEEVIAESIKEEIVEEAIEEVVEEVKKEIDDKKYKGVIWDRELEEWKVYIKKDKKRIHLGNFKTKEEAIRVKIMAEENFFK